MEVSRDELFKEERAFLEKGYDFVVGIDEAGRGPLAGPVVAAAATWRKHEILNSKFETISNDQSLDDQNFLKKLNLIRDSKKLSEKQREEIFDFIQEHFYVGVGICDHATIDRINILQATHLAMRNAVTDLNVKLKKCHPRVGGDPVQRLNDSRLDSCMHGNDKDKIIILVDGNSEIPNISIEQKTVVGGDNFVKSISAASIIAKVTRDRMMREAHLKFPQYNFEKHKGYGTKIHMEALKKFGPCEIHRRSFRPVREVEEMYRMMINNE